MNLVGHQSEVNDLNFTLDNLKIISCSSDWSIKLWDLTKA